MSNPTEAEIFFKSAQRGELLLSGNFGDSVTGTSNDFKDIPVTMEIFHFLLSLPLREGEGAERGVIVFPVSGDLFAEPLGLYEGLVLA